MDCLLALWPPLLLVSLVTCKVWSFDLYLKKLPCNMVYILTQNSIKHPCSTRDLGAFLNSVWVYIPYYKVGSSDKDQKTRLYKLPRNQGAIEAIMPKGNPYQKRIIDNPFHHMEASHLYDLSPGSGLPLLLLLTGTDKEQRAQER